MNSCDNSYFAEDTARKCLDDNGEVGYDMCCKTTVKKNKGRSQDFFCFVDKGSPEGNYAFCLGLADNPPRIIGSKPNKEEVKTKPRFLRVVEGAQQGVKSDNKAVLLLFIGLVGYIGLMLWRMIIDSAKQAAKLHALRNNTNDGVKLATIREDEDTLHSQHHW